MQAWLLVSEVVRNVGLALAAPGGRPVAVHADVAAEPDVVALSRAADRLGTLTALVNNAGVIDVSAPLDTFPIGRARESAAEGIRVDAVAPGIIDTEIHASGRMPTRVADIGPTLPMERAGTADEIAAPILGLLAEEASYTTGAIFDVDGDL